MQKLTEQVQNGAREAAFLTRSEAMPVLRGPRPTLGVASLYRDPEIHLPPSWSSDQQMCRTLRECRVPVVPTERTKTPTRGSCPQCISSSDV